MCFLELPGASSSAAAADADASLTCMHVQDNGFAIAIASANGRRDKLTKVCIHMRLTYYVLADLVRICEYP